MRALRLARIGSTLRKHLVEPIEELPGLYEVAGRSRIDEDRRLQPAGQGMGALEGERLIARTLGQVIAANLHVNPRDRDEAPLCRVGLRVRRGLDAAI